jgi:hypothetical protein
MFKLFLLALAFVLGTSLLPNSANASLIPNGLKLVCEQVNAGTKKETPFYRLVIQNTSTGFLHGRLSWNFENNSVQVAKDFFGHQFYGGLHYFTGAGSGRISLYMTHPKQDLVQKLVYDGTAYKVNCVLKNDS